MAERVAIYYRVSTADQTPDAQINELRDYALRRGFEVAAEYVETASGAARSRPEFGPDAAADVRSRKADVVLVWAFDRFARSTTHLVNTLEELMAIEQESTSLKQKNCLVRLMATAAW
jgi:DNA invertase Pin-like site-specific DNA recombinase